MTKKTKILISCLLILLCAGMIGYGALCHYATEPPEPKDEAAQLAELKADLRNAGSTSGIKGDEIVPLQQTRPRRPSRTRST